MHVKYMSAHIHRVRAHLSSHLTHYHYREKYNNNKRPLTSSTNRPQAAPPLGWQCTRHRPVGPAYLRVWDPACAHPAPTWLSVQSPHPGRPAASAQRIRCEEGVFQRHTLVARHARGNPRVWRWKETRWKRHAGREQ
jgi:hypothetical protein